jgi:signal transduction histidine kinase
MQGQYGSISVLSGGGLSGPARARLLRTRAFLYIFLAAIIAEAGVVLACAVSSRQLVFRELTGASFIALFAGLVLLRIIARAGARAEEHAEEGEARTRDFAEVAADWFCELDRDLKIAHMYNRYFAEAWPIHGDWIGMPWFQAGPKFHFRCLADSHRARLAAREPFHDHRFHLLRPGGSALYWSLSGKPILDKQGEFAGYRIAASDITPLVRVQEEFAAARDTAERASRAKSSFVAHMGHELRSPLVAVLGFSEIIGREMLGPPGNAKYAEYGWDIHHAAGKLLDTLNDILDLSSIEAGHLVLREQEFALWDVIEAMLRNCRAASRKSRVAVAASLPSALPCLRADPRRIRQLLTHLVSNAIALTPKGGRVTLETRRERDGDFSIIVRDNGVGMSPNEIDRAMQPFEQRDCGRDRKFEGAGLGLSIANMLASYHGGLLHVASVPGKGTAVTFTLPAVRVLRATTLLSA